MIVCDAARQIIMSAESCRLDAYRCPAGVLTIGWGHTGDVREGDKITQHQAETIFEFDLERVEEAVAKLAPTANSNQLGAMVSLAFNIGLKALERSTLLRVFNEGATLVAANEFLKWDLAKGHVLPGLVKRRAAERALFLTVPS